MSDSDAVIRWQAYARDSRTAVNSHFLAYSAAILALQISILVDESVKIIGWPIIFIISGILVILSLLLGSSVVLVRLKDARLTARIARYRQLGKPQKEIDALRDKADFYSDCVNNFLTCQVIIFSFSAIFFVFWLVGTHVKKLSGVVV